MESYKDLDTVVEDLKHLVVLYGDVVDELVRNLEETNTRLNAMNKENVDLRAKNKRLEDECDKIAKEKEEKIEELAKLKQKKIPSVDAITELMEGLQNMLVDAKKSKVPFVTEIETPIKKEKKVFDLRDDKTIDD